MSKSAYTGLEHDTYQVNSNFKIKVNGVNFDGIKMNQLVGVSGLIKLIGVDLANTLIERAFNSSEDSCTCKLRRGLKVTFYCH